MFVSFSVAESLCGVLSLSVCLSVCLYACRSLCVCLSVCVYVGLCVCVYESMSVCVDVIPQEVFSPAKYVNRCLYCSGINTNTLNHAPNGSDSPTDVPP